MVTKKFHNYCKKLCLNWNILQSTIRNSLLSFKSAIALIISNLYCYLNIWKYTRGCLYRVFLKAAWERRKLCIHSRYNSVFWLVFVKMKCIADCMSSLKILPLIPCKYSNSIQGYSLYFYIQYTSKYMYCNIFTYSDVKIKIRIFIPEIRNQLKSFLFFL